MGNYSAKVARIDKVIEIPKADKVQVALVLGDYCVVPKEWGVGFTGILFPTETQISHEFASNNNLYRNVEKNVGNKTGFFDDNRRVRCQKFLGVKSEAFFCQMEMLDFLPVKPKLRLGDEFTELGGVEICRKYEVERWRQGLANRGGRGVCTFAKVENVEGFQEHMDTDNFNYSLHKIDVGDVISIQPKIHGTSGRSGIQKVEQRLPWWKRVAQKFGVRFPRAYAYEHVVGTRRVILKNPGEEGFEVSAQFRFEVADKIRPALKPGVTAYYEIFGYANNKPIVNNHSVSKLRDKKFTKKYGDTIEYTYGCDPGFCDFIVYRVTVAGPAGEPVDLTRAQLVAWCERAGLPHAPDLVAPFVYAGDKDALVALVGSLTEREDVLTEDFIDPSQVSEGVIVRVDGRELRPRMFKSKSFAFKLMESRQRDEGIEEEA